MLDSRLLREISDAVNQLNNPIVQTVQNTIFKDYNPEQFTLILLISSLRRIQMKYEQPASYILQNMFSHTLALKLLIELTEAGFIDNHDRCTCRTEEFDIYCLTQPKSEKKY